ncbi:hypothetical protein LINPERHAP2_LOCUS29611, partial [Linum perenne]
INGLETRNHPHKIRSNVSSNLNNHRVLATNHYNRNLRNKEKENRSRNHLTHRSPNLR